MSVCGSEETEPRGSKTALSEQHACCLRGAVKLGGGQGSLSQLRASTSRPSGSAGRKDLMNPPGLPYNISNASYCLMGTTKIGK